jgi:hypothetical protein
MDKKKLKIFTILSQCSAVQYYDPVDKCNRSNNFAIDWSKRLAG